MYKLKIHNFSNRNIAMILALFLGALLSFSSCKKDNNTPNNTPALATTPLYDTLGWFIQGGQGQVSGSGTEMVSDPDNPGVQIQAGRLAIRTVVKQALSVIASDTSLAVYFPTLLNEVGAGNTTGMANLLGSFTDFVQQAVSGQKVYNGRTMLVAHNHNTYSRFGSAAHPVADEADFNQFINDVVIAAQSLNVPNSVIGQLGVLLTSVKGDVVQG